MVIQCIYKILCLVTGNFYIGSACNFKERNRYHIWQLSTNRHTNAKIQRSVNKYGIDSHIFIILEIVEDKNKLLTREQFYIDTLNPFFNICKNAGSNLGTKMSDATKNKISIANTGKKFPEKYKEIYRKERTGKAIHSEEAKRKIGECQKGGTGRRLGIPHSKETIAKMKEIRGTDEYRNKLKGFVRTDEWKNKQRESQSGRPWSEKRRLAQEKIKAA